jgi:hypothetical protein
MMIEKPLASVSPWVGSIDRVTFNMLNPGNGTGLVGVGSYRRNEWQAFYQVTTGALVDLPGRTSTPHGGGLLSLGQLAPPGMARPQSPIAALTRDDGQIHVFFVRPDGAVATTWSAWSGGRQPWVAPFAITPPGPTGRWRRPGRWDRGRRRFRSRGRGQGVRARRSRLRCAGTPCMYSSSGPTTR